MWTKTIMSPSRAQYQRFVDNRLGLRCLRDAGPAGPKLICLPHAGGQSLAFRELAEALPREWSLWGIDLPGHGWAAGPPLKEIPTMAELCVRHVPEEIMSGAIIFGHSLGGCVAFEIAARLAAAGTPPAGLVLSATRPPHRLADYESFVTMDDAQLLSCLIAIGGVPEEWAREPELFDHFKAAIRADLVAFESFLIARPLVGVRSLVLAGVQDMVCRPEHSFEWSRFCPGCRVELVRDGHVFVQTQAAWVAEQVTAFAQELPRDSG
jgi:surfactin synthase thioesterase subunit